MREQIVFWVVRVVRPLIVRWLEERELRFPQSRRVALAERLGIPVSAVEQIEHALREQVLQALLRKTR